MSGKDDNNAQLLNIEFIFATFEVFQFEISGKDDTLEYLKNI